MATTMATYFTPTTPDYSKMDRKAKKPLMEKQRRDKMNGFLEVLKSRVSIEADSRNSKLEKADILEKTVVLVERLDSQIAQQNTYIKQLVYEVAIERQERARFAEGVIQALVRQKAPAEVVKQVKAILTEIVPPAPQKPSIPPPMPNPMLAAFQRPRMPPPHHMIPPPPFCFFGGPPGPSVGLSPQFLQSPRLSGILPKHPSKSSQPVTPALSTSTASPSLPAAVKTEAFSSPIKETTPDDDDFSSDSEVDVENVDENSNEETFIDEKTPASTPRAPKRSLSSDDSGFGEPTPKKAFSIDHLLLGRQ